MTYEEARAAADKLLPTVVRAFGLEGYEIEPVEGHFGGRNVVYVCERAGGPGRVLRFSYLPDRTREDMLAELEFVRYLAENGGPVANVLPSRAGNLLEEFAGLGVSMFEKARGDGIAAHGYRYREGAPLSEYFYNCGKTLGKLHALAKRYAPARRRCDFFDKYNAAFLDELLPASLNRLKEKLTELLRRLAEVERDPDNYGLVHFDYGDGNYRIDYEDGAITVFDFDDCCTCWYMFDLASVWRNGTGWIQFEPDADKRRAFMADYFATVLAGYRSETDIGEEMLKRLPLFVQAGLMENILCEFEAARREGEEAEIDEALGYLIKCMEEDIPYLGFFEEIYCSGRPFALEEYD